MGVIKGTYSKDNQSGKHSLIIKGIHGSRHIHAFHCCLLGRINRTILLVRHHCGIKQQEQEHFIEDQSCGVKSTDVLPLN